MTGQQQRAELQRRIWQIANDVLYRFISENFSKLETTVAKITQLRSEIDAIVLEIEGEKQ